MQADPHAIWEHYCVTKVFHKSKLLKIAMEVALELETLSNETIKPSKSTPPHLKSYKLSFVDQLLSLLEYSSPMVFFYASPPSYNKHSDIVNQLKESLSITLSLYYPLAGRLFAHESIIDCNDEGIPLIVARANCTLFAFLGSSNRVNLVPQFIPNSTYFLDPSTIRVKGLIPMAFQVTIFECGGFAVGSHVINKALDGTSWSHFFTTWATVATNGGAGGPRLCEFVDRDLTVQTRIFPPVSNKNVNSRVGVPQVLQPVENGTKGCVVRTFEFSRNSISVLQGMARSEIVPNPTRVEAVTCFLWKHLMAAAISLESSCSRIEGQNNISTTSAVIHSVNIRPHLRPALPSTTFGKFVTHAFAYCETKPGAAPKLCDLVVVLRQALSKKMSSEFITSFQGERRVEAAFNHKRTLEELMPKAYFFTSITGFDQVDFGSGPPVWIGYTGGRPSLFFRNFIPLIHTKGHGIEAWLILDEREMAILASDQEFLAAIVPSAPASTFTPKALL